MPVTRQYNTNQYYQLLEIQNNLFDTGGPTHHCKQTPWDETLRLQGRSLKMLDICRKELNGGVLWLGTAKGTGR
jgi:hypothetical protein